ncbi:MAG TPA: RNase adapter RapZ [Acidimicrobiales bacterium]|nr:RNase adapter RapZ [Acidimicrobiales bacterium]
MSEYVVITGMSGAGRSQAADSFEDLGWFVIDNLPPPLIPRIVELAEAPGSSISRVALVAGGGTMYHDELVTELSGLRNSDNRVRILFLDAVDDVLVRRYENTRRRHPLSTGNLSAAIAAERGMLEDVKVEADVVVDTSELNVHELRDRVVELFGDDTDERMTITVQSFGYKHGLPLDADLVFDLRFLPNPHWVDELRPLTGRDKPVRDYVFSQPITREFLVKLEDLLATLLPAYVGEGKSYLTVAVGCTGGRHRSVAVAEELAKLVRGRGYDPSVNHRDVDR